MKDKRGFTLIELIVVLLVMAIATTFFVPVLFTAIEQTRAQTAQNNLLAISAGEQKYNEDYGTYYTGSGLATISAALGLSMATKDTFTYNCSGTYTCTATDGTVTLSASSSGVTCTGGGNYCPPP